MDKETLTRKDTFIINWEDYEEEEPPQYNSSKESLGYESDTMTDEVCYSDEDN